jgi:hypothetical protein
MSAYFTHLFMLSALLSPQALKENTPLAPQPEEIEIIGYFTCEGQTLEGTYDGVVVISKKRDTYLVRWIFQSGQKIIGSGMREGNTLWVGWSDQTTIGVCRYRIELENDRPRLVGDRGTNEKMTFLKPL